MSSPSAPILVVEDNLINQKVIEKMIQKCGFQVQLVGDGQKAVEAVAHGRYALIFMDCQMPQMDGFEAARQIRGLTGEAARVPIVAVTANAMKGDRERCLSSGMDDYVSKPFRLEDLRNVLNRWMAGGSAVPNAAA